MIPLLCLLLALAPVNLEIYPEKRKAILGEKINVEMVLPGPDSAEIKGVELPSGDIHVYKSRIYGNRINLEIGIFKLGKVEVPVKIFLLKEGRQEEIEMPGFTIEIIESVKGEARVKPIKDVIGFINWIWLLLLLIPLLLLLWALLRKKDTEEPEAVLSPLEWAQKRLREIKEDDLAGKGMYKEYYDEISDCLRIYLEKKHGLLAMRSTLSELQNDMKERFTPQIFMKIRKLLEECDWIKFTPEGRKPENIEEIWQRAYDMMTNEL
ncbi:hypothetical protein ACFLUV_04880 [Elusimicrobiota bacterium]